MLKRTILFAAILIGISCSLPTSAQNDRDVYDGGSGVYYMNKETMRDLIPALVSFKQQHKECHITSMAISHGSALGPIGLLINCDPVKVK